MIKMNLEEAKNLFKKHHPQEATYLKSSSPFKEHAACVWSGLKSALIITGQLIE